MAKHAVIHKTTSDGRPCGGPLTNDDTESRNPDVCRCCACGDFVEVDARTLTRVRKADAYWWRRRDREERGLPPPIPRLMSFAMTEPQLLDGSKDVTRRLGWEGLVGRATASTPVRLVGVRKAMGLKRGETHHRLRMVLVVDARRERLDAIDADDCRREGFPELTPAQFVAMFCEAHPGCTPATIVTRIVFRHGELLGPAPRQLELGGACAA
ncbi:MAG: hypothetical protein JNL82_14350 [Myxococcales bacterium]|nr:hypothetical protein [Myxococcales bacterium]